MPYLAHNEFTEFGFTEIDEVKFNNLLLKASAVLDNVTNYFYQRHDIDRDNEWRVNQFKIALSSQIEYFDAVGSTYESINDSPQSFSAGRTSVSNASRLNSSRATESKPLVSEDVYVYLEGTGLLYRGVATW